MAKEEEFDIRKNKKRDDDAEMDITPMIDVTFLLLAFFVVVSKMDPQAAVDLPKASYGDSIQDKACVTLILVLDESGEKPVIFKGRSMGEETQVPEGEEDDVMDNIGEYVENELSAHPTKTSILIKAEGKVRTRMVEMVKRGVGRSELGKSRKIYVGIEEVQ